MPYLYRGDRLTVEICVPVEVVEGVSLEVVTARIVKEYWSIVIVRTIEYNIDMGIGTDVVDITQP